MHSYACSNLPQFTAYVDVESASSEHLVPRNIFRLQRQYSASRSAKLHPSIVFEPLVRLTMNRNLHCHRTYGRVVGCYPGLVGDTPPLVPSVLTSLDFCFCFCSLFTSLLLAYSSGSLASSNMPYPALQISTLPPSATIFAPSEPHGRSGYNKNIRTPYDGATPSDGRPRGKHFRDLDRTANNSIPYKS